MTPFRLILASGSPARRDLLKRAGFEFEILPAYIDEPTDAGFADARSYVQYVAWLKAHAVAAKLRDDSPQPAVILAADTVGWLHGRAIGKPIDEADARRILRLLAGTEHELWTGVCLWRRPGDFQLSWQEVSRVAMTAMTEAELEADRVRFPIPIQGAQPVADACRYLAGSGGSWIGGTVFNVSNGRWRG